MSALEISPAPIELPCASPHAAQGNKDASQPMTGTSANAGSAGTLKDETAPIQEPQAEHGAAPSPQSPPVVHTTIAVQTRDGDGWQQLRIWAEMFYDVQKARIGCSNRMERGGVVAAEYESQINALKVAEKEMKKGLVRCYLRVVPAPIVEWQKDAVGIGEHSLARLLGQLGHPAIAEPYHWEESDGEHKRILIADEPYARSLRQLWAYCGHGDPTRKRKVGMSQDDALAGGSVLCKMIVHQLLAIACIKNTNSPYRAVYDERRAVTIERDWTLGHAHNDALRIVGKEILRDLWVASVGSL